MVGPRKPVGAWVLLSCEALWMVATLWWWVKRLKPVDYTGRVLPDYSSAAMIDFALFLVAGMVMLLGSVAIPIAVAANARRFKAWGLLLAATVTTLGLVAAIQCAFMVARFLGVAPF